MSDHYFYDPHAQQDQEQEQQYQQPLQFSQQSSQDGHLQHLQQVSESQGLAQIGQYHPLHSLNTQPHHALAAGHFPLPQKHMSPTDYNASFYNVNTQLDQQMVDGSMARWFDQERDLGGQQPKTTVRMRRKAPAGADHVKHRRTRSGCYTCRSRRVKCDETHPICDRCKKGSRDCVYPEPTSATKSTGSKLGQSSKPGDESSTDEEEYEEELESPVEQKDKPRVSISNPKDSSRTQSRTGLQGRKGSESIDVYEKSLSPSTTTDESVYSRSGKLSSVSTSTSLHEPSWSHLSPELRFYLDYHRTHLNHNFYFFKHDAPSFVHDILPNVALQYDPLLYAVVGFAAYHHTLTKPGGKLSEFLSFYNKSVSLLRKSLQSNQKRTSATILTILQLAAFEEYLGDWVNLVSHQKAAYEMINELYSPETIMKDDTSRKLFDWYARFDLFAGLMTGNPTTLGKEWYEASMNWYCAKSEEDPSNVDTLLESMIATNRNLGVEMALLFGKLPKGEISMEDFFKENAALGAGIRDCKTRLDPLVNPSEHKVMSFENAPLLPTDHIVDPYQPGRLFKEPLFSANYMLMDWYAIDAMHKYQTSQVMQQPPPAELFFNGIEQCRIIEAMDLWPGSPRGAVLPVQASLGIVCMFLPRDQKYSLWCRQKLAKMEANGYIYPPVFRAKMVEQWNMPSLHHWWLDNEEGYPSIIKAIRSFIEERTIQPRTKVDQDLRTMTAIFSKLNYDESPKESPESMASSANDSYGKNTYGSPQSGTSGSQIDN